MPLAWAITRASNTGCNGRRAAAPRRQRAAIPDRTTGPVRACLPIRNGHGGVGPVSTPRAMRCARVLTLPVSLSAQITRNPAIPRVEITGCGRPVSAIRSVLGTRGHAAARRTRHPQRAEQLRRRFPILYPRSQTLRNGQAFAGLRAVGGVAPVLPAAMASRSSSPPPSTGRAGSSRSKCHGSSPRTGRNRCWTPLSGMSRAGPGKRPN